VDAQTLGRILGSLIVVSLFLERALDVYLTTGRASESEKMEDEIQRLTQVITDLKAFVPLPPAKEQEMNVAAAELKKVKEDKADYRAGTRNLALWLGLVFGLLISAVGLRTLQSLAESESLEALSKWQLNSFRIVDVLLTGGLIAGGSEGIHKITEVYRSFMDRASERAKQSQKT